MTPEEQRLRAALTDIAQAGGWQGRFAQEVLDTPAAPAVTVTYAPCANYGTEQERQQAVRHMASLVLQELRRQGVRL